MLAGRTVRQRALGQALAGFACSSSASTRSGHLPRASGATMNLQDHIAPGFTGWLILVGIGTLPTVLMRQASGAVIAIIITAAQGGLDVDRGGARDGDRHQHRHDLDGDPVGAGRDLERAPGRGHPRIFNLVTGAVAIDGDAALGSGLFSARRATGRATGHARGDAGDVRHRQQPVLSRRRC